MGFVDSNTLILADDIGSELGISYTLYVSTPNEGCSIYIPAQTPDKITVVTLTGDIVLLHNCGDLNAHTILPIQVKRIFPNNLTNLVALW